MTNLDSMFKQRHYFANDFKEIYKSSVSEETFFFFFAHTISARLMIKRHLLLGRKVTTNLDSILKSRGITLPTKVHLVKAMVFPVVMYGCDSWTVKKAEHQ